MPNMSYCRFENTVLDMNDCLNAIEYREVNNLSDYELRALKDFLELGQAILDNEDEIKRIIDEHNDE